MALAVALVIVITGIRLLLAVSRVLVDESLPQTEVEAIRERSTRSPAAAWSATTSCARGGRARARYVDLHVQFREGTSLEDAHRTAHELQDLIGYRLAAPTC